MLRKLWAPAFLFALLSSTGALVGCNTIEGMGEDMQSGGEEVEDTAEETDEEIEEE
jgi:predicted small secreted protein